MGHFIIHLKDTDDPTVYLQRAAEIIIEGGILVYPTDTVYGIGADPLNINAIHRLFTIKQRDIHRGVPILVPDLEDAMKIGSFAPIEQKLVEFFWPGSLTLVVPLSTLDSSHIRLSTLITGGTDQIAIRIPHNPIILGICKALKELRGFGGIIGTSANFSGQPNIVSGKRVVEEFSNTVDFLIDTGECKEKTASTVIRIDHSQTDIKESLIILREGSITKAQILNKLRKIK